MYRPDVKRSFEEQQLPWVFCHWANVRARSRPQTWSFTKQTDLMDLVTCPALIHQHLFKSSMTTCCLTVELIVERLRYHCQRMVIRWFDEWRTDVDLNTNVIAFSGYHAILASLSLWPVWRRKSYEEYCCQSQVWCLLASFKVCYSSFKDPSRFEILPAAQRFFYGSICCH